MYPLRTVPGNLDDTSVVPHVLAGHLLDRAVIQLPSVRYRGFQTDPSLVSGAVATAGLATVVSSSAVAAKAVSAAWNLQQRLEFFPFEERLKKVPVENDITDAVVEPLTGATAVAVAVGTARGGAAGSMLAHGANNKTAVAGRTRSDEVEEGLLIATSETAAGRDRNHTDGGGGIIMNARVDKGTTAAPTSSMAGAAATMPVVLADYLGDTSTIGMAVVDQPGMGMTTALLGFLEWYCRGEATGGRQVSEHVGCDIGQSVLT